MSFYTDHAEWWPLFSPAIHYVDEAKDLLQRLEPLPAPGTATMLELGSGGGSLATHLKARFKLTLTDLSGGMLAQNQLLNPEAEFFQADMRTLRLDREFDYVLVHDAVCYMTTVDDLRAAIATAAIHCRRGGTVAVLPDFVKETFSPGTEQGGEDDDDGRVFRYFSWCWDPDPADTVYLVDYAFVMRDASGVVRTAHERHVEGVFPRATWLELFADAGLDAVSQIDAFGRDIFIARKP